MTKKQALRVILFAGVFLMVIWGLSTLFRHKDLQRDGRFKNFQGFEKNTVEAVILGTSGIDRFWIAPKAYEEYGITMYPLSTDAQPSFMMKYLLEHVKRTQDIKLAVIDMRPFTVDYEDKMDRYSSTSRRVLDVLEFFSLNRLKAVKTVVDGLETIWPEEEHDILSFYFPFIKFHSRWEEEGYLLDENDEQFKDYLGFFMRRRASTKGRSSFEETVETDARRSLYPICEKALYDLLEYLDKQDYEVLFLNTPHYHDQVELERINTICDILDEKGYKYKLYDVDDGTFNLLAEYYDNRHVNYYGANRFTAVFAQYLNENYEFSDCRENPACAKDWSGAYDKIKKQIKKWSKYEGMVRPELTVSIEDAGLQISWDVQEDVLGYEIFRNTMEGGRYQKLQNIKVNEAGSFSDTDVQDEQTYYYMIRAYKNVDGKKTYSRWSPVVSAVADVE